jgi:hypothetical protein
MRCYDTGSPFVISTILGMAQPIIPPVLENFSSTACDMLEQYCISGKEELNAETYSCSRTFDEFSTPHDGMTSVPVSQDLAVRIET